MSNEPRNLHEVRRHPSRDDEVAAALRALEKFADVMMPEDAIEPILGPKQRRALIEWMTEIRAADDLARLRVKPRRTALLYGEPGTGKTTFAHHFAARLGQPLACIRSESLIEKYLGSSGRNVAGLFDLMKQCEGKVVMFFDEIDAVGGKRRHDQSCDVERAATLNVLLRRIETFEGVCLAATNIHEQLDPALFRRFGLQIQIDMPGFDERFAILRMYADPLELDDHTTDILAEVTNGASPALIKNMMENMKRLLAIGPRIKRDVSNATEVIRAAVASVSPPPGSTEPPLWRDFDRTAKTSLQEITWPWPMKESES